MKTDCVYSRDMCRNKEELKHDESFNRVFWVRAAAELR